MSDSLESLRRKIHGAGELAGVVHTMKALAASSIGQYERALESLDDYYLAVELALSACFKKGRRRTEDETEPREVVVNAVVFGSDQGLVGQFNETLGDFVQRSLAQIHHEKRVWVVGERMRYHLTESGIEVEGGLKAPNSVAAITPLVGQILVQTQAASQTGEGDRLLIFHNRPASGRDYQPALVRLLPLDERWRSDLAKIPWPAKALPQVISAGDQTLYSLIGEYLFVSIFRACAQSLASEQASRLSAMQRAEKNIEELLAGLELSFNRLRQSTIDEELFEVVSGFEALMGEKNRL